MKLITQGLKARDARIELGSLTLLVGNNGAGKSTIADGIRFLALGYVPSLGKRPADTAALMRDGRMEVGLALDDGRTIERSLYREGDSLKTSAGASWIKSQKSAEAAAAIGDLFGGEERDAAECLDIRQLLAATPNDRAQRLERLMQAAGSEVDARITAICRRTVQRLLAMEDERMPADYRVALPMLAELHAATLKTVAEDLAARVTDGGLEGCQRWANESKREAGVDLKRRQAAEIEIQGRLKALPEASVAERDRLAARAEEIAREGGAAGEKRAAHGRALNAARAAGENLGKATEALRDLMSQNVDAMRTAAESFRATAKRAQDLLDNMKQPVREESPDLARMRAEIADLDQKIAAVELPVRPTVHGYGEDLAVLQAKLAAAERSPFGEILAAVKRIRKIQRAAPGVKPELDKIETLCRAAIDDPDELRKAVSEMGAAAEREEDEQKAHEQALAESFERRNGFTEARRQIERKAKGIGVEADNAYAAALNGYEAERRRRIAEREDALEAAVDLEAKCAAHAEHLARLKGQVAQAQAAVDALPDPGHEPKSADPAEANGVRAQLAAIGEAIAARKALTDILAGIDDCKAEHEVFSAIEWAVQRVRADEISGAGGRLIQTMTEFLQGADRPERPYVEAGQGRCEIGWERPEGDSGIRRVPVQALSGGEWALYAAALTSAVVLIRPSVLKILLVEAGETDEKTLTAILAGVSGIAQGLTAAIVMVQRKPEKAPEGWALVDLGGAQTA